MSWDEERLRADFRRLFIDRAFCVYRVFDADGACLYVGMTDNIPSRRNAHKHKSPWAKDAARFILTGPLPQVHARDLELREIWRLEPPENKRVHHRLRDYMAGWDGPEATILTEGQYGSLKVHCEYQLRRVRPIRLGSGLDYTFLVPTDEIHRAVASYEDAEREAAA